MNAKEKAKELFEKASHVDSLRNYVYSMTHHQRKQVAITTAKEVLGTLNSLSVKIDNENHMLLKATVDYWNEVVIACNLL